MSGKERKRIVVLNQVRQGLLSLPEAARVMRVCYRQAKRIWGRFRQRGDAGLVHGSRGRPGARRKSDELKRQVLARYKARYPDFGPTFAAEKLLEDGLAIDHETLRRWLIVKGLWQAGRRRHKHRAWRERRACFGEMVQLDGSHHDWFEGRAPRAVLMVMIDDATNRTVARFFEEETTRASYDVFAAWVTAHGLPGSLYVDRDSIYRCERDQSIQEQIDGSEPRTQFGRAMDKLGVEVILANSPQAKGRVERRNAVFQDRLVKELRLEGIGDLPAANRFLEQTFLPSLNKRFTVEARSKADAHRVGRWNLAEVLSWEDERIVGHDWTVAWNGRWFQIDPAHERLSLVKRSITVRQRRCGMMEFLYRGALLKWKELPARPQRALAVPRRMGRRKIAKPASTHPWRNDAVGYGQRHWQKEKANGAKTRAVRIQVAAASAAPSLRSGFAPAAAT